MGPDQIITLGPWGVVIPNAIGPERTTKLTAVSMDMGGAYLKATAERVAHAAVCIEPFHVMKLANEAIDAARRWAWNAARRQGTDARWVKHTRWALVKGRGALSNDQRGVIERLRIDRSVLFRAWRLRRCSPTSTA